MPHYFMRSAGGVAVVVVAGSAAAAEALAEAVGLPRMGRPAYRADPEDLRAHTGAFRLVGGPAALRAAAPAPTGVVAGAWTPLSSSAARQRHRSA